MTKQDFENAIHELLKDNLSGSLSIVNNLIILSEKYLKSKDFDPLFIIEQYLQVYFKFPEFAVLFHFLNKAFPFLSQNKAKQFEIFLSEYIESYDSVNSLILENIIGLHDYNDKTIFVHSNSSTVKEVVSEIANNHNIKEIIQTISYPAKEGIVQAEYFAKKGVKLSLIPDAAIFKFVKLADVVLLGADTIFEEFFINKIGTQSIAIAANYFNKPVYVLSDSRKIVDHKKLNQTLIKAFLNEKEKPSDELYDSNSNNIRPLNYYFEKTPTNLITSFISEKGLSNHANIYEHGDDLELSEIFQGI
jgi:translation initiation factor 2B subunit (eIF-2B alpha/beta/delta family)